MLLLLSLIVLVVIAQKNNNQSVNYKNSSFISVRDYLKSTQPQIWYSFFTQGNGFSSKATDEFKQALDSTIIMAQAWTKDFVKDESYFYSYDMQGRCVTIQYNEYVNLVLSPQEKKTMMYDNIGRPLKYIVYEYEEAVWVSQMKVEYVFSGDVMSELMLYNWNETSNEWILELKEEITYNANNYIVSLVTQSWEDGSFINSYKEETTYYENQYIHESISYIWASSGDWGPLSKTENSYDDNWHNILEIVSDWASVEWRETEKTENTFEEENMVLSILSTNYAYGDWDFEDKNEYTYDEFGNTIENIEYEWLSENWNPQSKETFNFNYDYTNDELLMPFIMDYYFNNMLISVYDFTYFSDDWVEEKQQLMYYSEKNVNTILEINTANDVVYPNPNNGVFNLKINSESQDINVSVLDFSGHIVYSETISNSKMGDIEVPFDLSVVGTGVYIIRISQYNQISYQKVVIQ